MVYNWLKNAQSILQPQSCTLCGQESDYKHSLCSACIPELPRNLHSCIRCALPLANQNSRTCGECLQRPPFVDRAYVPFEYTAPFNQFIPALKFNHKLEYAPLMSELFMREYAQHHKNISGTGPQCLIPVPLHSKRLRQRGFNQSLEISRSIASCFNLDIELTAIKRIKNTHAQSDLDKSKRKHNMKNAFEVTRALPYKHVVVFDDVVTTGHTVNELARALKRSGVTTVEVWAIARA